MELGVILSCAVVSYIDPQLKKLITARFHPSQQQNTHILSTYAYLLTYFRTIPYSFEKIKKIYYSSSLPSLLFLHT